MWPGPTSVCLLRVSSSWQGLLGLRACSRGLHSQPSSECIPVSRQFQQAITPNVCAELSARGYAVVDGVFGSHLSQQLQLELSRVYQSGLMHVNHTHLVSKGQTHLLAKSQIQEAELTFDQAVRDAAPLVSQLNVDRSLCTMLSLLIPQLRLEQQTIKMQYNEGDGGCFPMHFDSDEQLDGRRVTAIFYLNTDWHPDHGGQLRLYPFPAPPVDIPPLGDRLVLFSSSRMLHRVLPSTVPRSCFTIWLSQGRSRASDVLSTMAAAAAVVPSLPAAGVPDEDVWKFLMQPAVRQHVCKLAYEGEWARSLHESHPSCSETDAVVLKHQQEVAKIRRALSRCQPALQVLLDAAAKVQQAWETSAAAESAGGAGSVVKEGGGRGAPQQQLTAPTLEQAYNVLRRAAAHVRWL